MSPLEIFEKGLPQRVPEKKSWNVLASYPYSKFEYPDSFLPVEIPALIGSENYMPVRI